MNQRIFYKLMAKPYDLLETIYFHKRERSPRKAICDAINPSDVKILDLCTGTAINAIHIAQQKLKARIIGIDLSKDMLHIARKKIRKHNLNRIDLYQMDATKTRFQKEVFDVIVIALVLHEIPRELAINIISEAKRILKPNGKILVMEWEEPKSFFQRIVFFPIKKLEPKGFDQFLKLDLKSYFLEYGLTITEIRHCDYSKVISLEKL